MTGKNSVRAALGRLADALVEDILNASDEEMLAEARHDHADPDAVVAAMRVQFEKAVLAAGKARLDAARAAVAGLRPAGAVTRLDPAEARQRLERAMTQDPETARKLTLAARKGEGLSDSDVTGMLEDLAELGLIPGPDKP